MAHLQFSGVSCDRISGLSFVLESGCAAVLRMASKDERLLALELAAGERAAEAGRITLHGLALADAPAGSIAWLPENGGLISNLKAWENATLPLWYHQPDRPEVDEGQVRRWLAQMGVNDEGMADLMASPVGRLRTVERKMIGLLRCLLQAPQLIVLDAALFNGVAQERRQAWLGLLESFAAAAEQRAVLAVADGENTLHWEMVRQT